MTACFLLCLSSLHCCAGMVKVPGGENLPVFTSTLVDNISCIQPPRVLHHVLRSFFLLVVPFSAVLCLSDLANADWLQWCVCMRENHMLSTGSCRPQCGREECRLYLQEMLIIIFFLFAVQRFSHPPICCCCYVTVHECSAVALVATQLVVLRSSNIPEQQRVDHGGVQGNTDPKLIFSHF